VELPAVHERLYRHGIINLKVYEMAETTYKLKNSPQPLIHARPIDRKPDRKGLWVALFSLIFLLPLVLFSGMLIIFQTQQLNIPNVFILDRNVGMLSREETALLVDEIYNQNRVVLLTPSGEPDIRFELSPQALGLWVDPQATADAAYALGRNSDPITDLRFAFNGDPHMILPVLYFDENTARQSLESIAEELNISPANASVSFQEGAWIALPGRSGRIMEIEPTIEDLFENAFSIFMTGEAAIHLKTLQPEVLDLSPVLDQIETLVAQEYALKAYDPIMDQTFEWSIPLESKLSWVTIEPDTQQPSLAFRNDDIEALVALWTQALGEGRTIDPDMDISYLIEGWQNGQTPSVTIDHLPTTYLVSQGESLWSISLKLGMPLWYIMDANPGLTMNNLRSGMELTIPSKNILLPLPPVPNKRIVIDISTQRMTVYENGEIRNTHIVSTGVADSPTMAGIFQIQTHELNAYASNWDLYMPHFLGIYEAWPGFMNGIHGLPLLSSGNRLWASNLGSPASYGCIILDLAAAEDLFYWADPGVVVEIIK
jgi:LysM repeat protein